MADAQWRLRRFTRIETGILYTLIVQAEASYRPEICWNISDPDPTPEATTPAPWAAPFSGTPTP